MRRLPLLLSIVIILIGCQHGGPDLVVLAPTPDPPTAPGRAPVVPQAIGMRDGERQTPDPVVIGVAARRARSGPGYWQTFAATANYSVAAWDWNFAGGATPRIAGSYSVMPVLLGQPGEYEGSVVARTADGRRSEPYSFGFKMSAEKPVVTYLGPGGTPAWHQGERVTFRAVATGFPTDWQWVLSPLDQVVPPEYGANHQSVTMTLGTTGNRGIGIRVTNALGVNWKYIQYGVDWVPYPPLGYTTSPITIGHRDDPIQWQTRPEYYDPLTLGYRWDFGGGAFPNESTSPSPVVQLGAPGNYTGTVWASGSGGESAPSTFRVTVPRDWNIISPGTDYLSHQGQLLTIGNELYVLSGTNTGTGFQLYVWHTPLAGAMTGGRWSGYWRAFPETRPRNYTHLQAVVAGNRLVCRSDNLLMYSGDSAPVEAADWTQEEITGCRQGDWLTLAGNGDAVLLAGRTVIPTASDSALCVGVHLLGQPNAPWEWEAVAADGDWVRGAITLQRGFCVPYLESDGMHFRQACLVTPQAQPGAGDWTSYLLPTTSFVADATLYHGRPLLLVPRDRYTNPGFDLLAGRTSVPLTPADWEAHTVPSGATNPSLYVESGQLIATPSGLAIGSSFFLGNGHYGLRVLTADSDGSPTADDWHVEVFPDAIAEDFGASIAAGPDGPLVAWVSAVGRGSLQLAAPSTRW